MAESAPPPSPGPRRKKKPSIDRVKDDFFETSLCSWTMNNKSILNISKHLPAKLFLRNHRKLEGQKV